MHPLLAYLNGLPVEERGQFAARCETSVGYLRKAVSTGQLLGEGLCINIERESGGVVRCEQLRPKVDWAYLRGTAKNGAQVFVLDCGAQLDVLRPSQEVA